MDISSGLSRSKLELESVLSNTPPDSHSMSVGIDGRMDSVTSISIALISIVSIDSSSHSEWVEGSWISSVEIDARVGLAEGVFSSSPVENPAFPVRCLHQVLVLSVATLLMFRSQLEIY